MSDTEHTHPVTGDMTPEEFKESLESLATWAADYLSGFDNTRVTPDLKPGDILTQLPPSPPESGEPMDSILPDLDRIITPGMTHWNHPGFMAYFTSSGSGAGILGELVSAVFNVNAMVWASGPAATELEQVTVDWVRQLLGLPDGFFGCIHEGASAGCLHALVAARESLSDLQLRERGMIGRGDLPKLRVYLSEQAHSSIDKAVMTLGFGLDSIHRVTVDDAFRMRPDELARAIDEDRREGERPFCVVATVGSTSCTAIDPVPEIAAVCKRENLWLHVDAAHGGSAAIVPEMRYILDGCEQADSFIINPHKWMFVPIDLSLLFVRDRETLRRAFSLTPEYLKTPRQERAVNYMDYGITLGRRFRALKLWFVLRYFGREGLANRIREHLELAREFTSWVDDHPTFERLAPVPLSTVCFRAHPKGMDDVAALNDLNERLMHAVNSTGRVFLSHTKLNDGFVIRLVVSHLRVERRHVEMAWEILQEKLAGLVSQ